MVSAGREWKNEQWQEVISRRNKQRSKKANQSSLLSVERSHKGPKKIVQVKDRAAGHLMPETMFPPVKLERKTSPKKFFAAYGEQIKDVGEKNIPFKTNEQIQRCITFRSASVLQPLISMQKVVRAGNIVVLHEPRNTVCTQWTCGFALMKQAQFFSWQGQ